MVNVIYVHSLAHRSNLSLLSELLIGQSGGSGVPSFVNLFLVIASGEGWTERLASLVHSIWRRLALSHRMPDAWTKEQELQDLCLMLAISVLCLV